MKPAQLSVEGLSVAYTTGRVLAGVSFEARGGTIVGVVGPNGAGKSTLLKALLGMVPIDGGRILLDAAAPGNEAYAYMPQRSEIDWDYPALARQVVAMGGWRAGGFGGLRLRQPAGLRQRAEHALQRLGMAAFAQRQIGELSGGQRQRVLLARTLVRDDAPVLLLDEPFAAVDAATEAVLWDELQREAASGRLVVVVHHELASVARFDQVLLLGARRSAFGPASEILTRDLLAQAYGAAPLTPWNSDVRRAVHRPAA